jgi:hypothetical protein
MTKKPQALVPQTQTIDGEFEEVSPTPMSDEEKDIEYLFANFHVIYERQKNIEAYLKLLGRTMGHTGIPQYEPPKWEVNND